MKSISDPPLSDNGFKNKVAWVWTTLKGKEIVIYDIKITVGFQLMKLRPEECLLDSILEFQCIVSRNFSSRCSWKSRIRNTLKVKKYIKSYIQILLKILRSVTFILSMSLIVTRTTNEIIKRKTNIPDKTKPIPSLSKNLISIFKKSQF